MLEVQPPFSAPQVPTPAFRFSQPSLAGTRLFASPHLSADERGALSGAASAMRPIDAGQRIIQEGARAAQLYTIIDGWACRYKTTREGSRQIVAVLVPGDTANLDCALLDRTDYGVTALTAIKTVAIPRDRLLTLADRHSGIAKTLAWLGCIENAILSQWALCLGRQSAVQRLAHLLCELGVRLGAAEDEASFELPLTQEQIADVLGLTPVHVNRTLQQLRADGLIEAGTRMVTIADVDALRRVAEFDPAYLHQDQGDRHGDRTP